MRRAFVYMGLGSLVLLLLIVVVWWIYTPTLQEWRDIVVIVLGLFTLIWAILLVGLTVALIAFIGFLRDKLGPVMDKVNSSAETVRGTTAFVGERVSSPLIKVSAAAAGARAAVQTLVRRENGR